MIKRYDELSMCGLYCAACLNYKEQANCQGCRREENLVEDCPTRACCIAKGLLHCGMCDEFPCTVLREFYHDGRPHHRLALQNMIKINEIGVEAWLVEQNTTHRCQCGKKKRWLTLECVDKDCDFK